MTPIERIVAYGKGEAIDRLPCVPIMGSTGARIIGEKLSTLRGDGKLMAKAQIEAYRKFGYDSISIFPDLSTLPEALGAKVYVPDDATARIEEPAVSDEAGIKKLTPAESAKSPILQRSLEAMRITLDAVGKEVPVSGGLTAPFTVASLVMGEENISRLMLRNPAAVHELCEISLQSCLNYAKDIIETGCSPGLADPMGSGTVISRKHFQTFAFPYLKRLIEYIHSRGKPVSLHICGKTDKIWDLMADTGADCLSIDNEVSMRAAKEAVGNRVRIMGNVPPTEVMFYGTVADVREATRRCIEEACDSPKGVIIGTGCALVTGTPFENISAMVKTVEEAGWPVKL
jgi:uroporphyrinogen decarboxylase